MDDSECEDHIQRKTRSRLSPRPSEELADLARGEIPVAPGPLPQQSLVAGMIFGGFAGLLMCAVAGAACTWLLGQFDYYWHGFFFGAAVGPCAGVLAGFVERSTRGDLVRPDIATILGGLFGVLPGLILLLQGFGVVEGVFSGGLLLGAVSGGPMAGFLIGGILDRAFESFLNRSVRRATTLALTAIALCAGIVVLMDGAAYGPDPKEVARQARALIISTWRKDPDTKDATIQALTLTRDGRRRYNGFAEAKIAGQLERLALEALVEGGELAIRWKIQR